MKKAAKAARTGVMSIAWLLGATLAVCSYGDEIVMRSGNRVSGKIIRNDGRVVVVDIGKGRMELPRASVVEINYDSAQKDGVPSGERHTIPTSRDAVASLRAMSWSAPVFQIPATVIDTGILKGVPYVSFRVAQAYEMNVYGNPDNPAGIEIGIYIDKDATPQGKLRCMEFIRTALPFLADEPALKGGSFDATAARVGNFTVEITPATASDAYGGWWVSVYDEQLLDLSRAPEKEITRISTPVAKLPVQTENAENHWTQSDLKQSRRYTTPSSSSSYSSGRVYVKGYYRKDGTYVRPHTRRR